MGARGPIGVETRIKRARQGAPTSAVSTIQPAVTSEPTAPAGLSDSARIEWDRITGLLRERGVLDALDQAALHDYLTTWARLREAEVEIEKNGLLVVGARGGLVRNPAIGIARGYRQALVVWCQHFGLTLGARTRLAMPGAAQRKTPNRFESIRDGESVN